MTQRVTAGAAAAVFLLLAAMVHLLVDFQDRSSPISLASPPRLTVELIALAGMVVAGAFALLTVGGYLGKVFGGTEHPPCETLPSPEQVRRALDQHTELTGKLTAIGEGVRVGVDTPCDDKQAALVEVRVRSDP